MAVLQIVFWRDIPSQVIVKTGRRDQVKRMLDQRFQSAIDRAAMIAHSHDENSYLEAWRKSEPVTVGDDMEAEADAAVTRLEADWDRDRLRTVAKAGGWEKEAQG